MQKQPKFGLPNPKNAFYATTIQKFRNIPCAISCEFWKRAAMKLFANGRIFSAKSNIIVNIDQACRPIWAACCGSGPRRMFCVKVVCTSFISFSWFSSAVLKKLYASDAKAFLQFISRVSIRKISASRAIRLAVKLATRHLKPCYYRVTNMLLIHRFSALFMGDSKRRTKRKPRNQRLNSDKVLFSFARGRERWTAMVTPFFCVQG